nr:hypothetical protein [Homoserinibacter gongjuensis]
MGVGAKASGSANAAGSRFAARQSSTTMSPAATWQPSTTASRVATRRFETKGSSSRRISSIAASSS